MNLIFSDSPSIDELTFKRLLLLGNELTFVDRPSIQYVKNLGTVGTSSNIRSLLPIFENSPIVLRVEEPPTTVFSSEFYKQYIKTDITNPIFINTVIDGIRNEWIEVTPKNWTVK